VSPAIRSKCSPEASGEPNTRADKIGDAVSFGNGEFLVVERDDEAVPEDDPAVRVGRMNSGSRERK